MDAICNNNQVSHDIARRVDHLQTDRGGRMPCARYVGHRPGEDSSLVEIYQGRAGRRAAPARSDFRSKRHRLLQGCVRRGGAGKFGRDPRAGPRHGSPRALVSGTHGPGDLRRPLPGWTTRGYRAARIAAAGRRVLRGTRLASGRGAGTGVLSGQGQHRS